MAEYIEREAALSLVQPDEPEDEKASVTIATAKKLVRYILHHTPAADVAPVVHGKWIPVEAYGIGNTAKCSECEKRQYGYDGFKFCPNCGAKMDGDIK